MRRVLVAALAFSPLPVVAGIEAAAYEMFWSSEPTVVIGGPSDAAIAQTFVAELGGPLHHVELVFSCTPDSTGLFTVELRDVAADGTPGEIVLASVGLDASRLMADPIHFQDVPLSGVELTSGSSYALVARADAGATCIGSWSVIEGAIGTYTGGTGYQRTPPAPWSRFAPSRDLPFYVYVEVPEPTGPRYCDFTDASGVPNTWLLASVPICGCLRDEVYRTNRCWFTFPQFVLWREIEPGTAYVRWGVMPMRAPFPGVNVEEFGIDGNLLVAPADFVSGLAPGKATIKSVPFTGSAAHSRVRVRYQSATGPVTATFTTRVTVPTAQASSPRSPTE